MRYEEEQAAKELAKFLSTSKGYQGKSPLEDRVHNGITKMADEIADEVISAYPELRTVIYTEVTKVIALAMQEDKYLSKIVVEAVAKKLGTYIADRGLGEEAVGTDDDEDDDD